MSWGDDEEEWYMTTFHNLGTVKEVPGDGNCLLYALQACVWAAEDKPRDHTPDELIESGKEMRKRLAICINNALCGKNRYKFEQCRAELKAEHPHQTFKSPEMYRDYIKKDGTYLTASEIIYLANILNRAIEVYYYQIDSKEFECFDRYLPPESKEQPGSDLRIVCVCYDPVRSMHEYVLQPLSSEFNHYIPITHFTKAEVITETITYDQRASKWMQGMTDKLYPILTNREEYFRLRGSTKQYGKQKLKEL